MSCEIPESSGPISVSEVSPGLQRKFRALFDETHSLLNTDRDPEAAEAAEVAVALLHQRIIEEVSANPILARIIHDDRQDSSLLEVVCNHGRACHETVKFVIETNPYAQLYQISGGYKAPIHLIAANGSSCALLPWIAERYPWVFEHQLCQNNPPHLLMVECYANDRCGPETVRMFYELYPQGLGEKGRTVVDLPMYPLFASIDRTRNPDADLFIWMAKLYPEAVHDIPIAGYTFLHCVCGFLVRERCTPNMANICRFLISEYPGLIRFNRDGGFLPIHLLARRCNRALVQEMVVILLKAYPECVEVRPRKFLPRLLTVPFIQHVHPLIMKEMEIDDEVLFLAQLSEHISEAVILSTYQFDVASASNNSALNASLLHSLSEVFCSWANLRVSDVLATRRKGVQERIAEACRRFEGDDVPGGFVVEGDVEEEGVQHVVQDLLSESEDDYDSGGSVINGEDNWNEYSASRPEDDEDGDFSDEIEDYDNWDEERASQSEDEGDYEVYPKIQDDDGSYEGPTCKSRHDETADAPSETEDKNEPYVDHASQYEREESADDSDKTDVEEDSFEDRAPRFEDEEYADVAADKDDSYEDREEDDDVPVEIDGVYEDHVSQADDQEDNMFDVKKEDDDAEDRASDDDVPDEIEDEARSFEDGAAESADISDKTDAEEDSSEDRASRFEDEEYDDVSADEGDSYEDRASQYAIEEDDDVPAELEEEDGAYDDRESQVDIEQDDDGSFNIRKEDDDFEDRASEFENQEDNDVPDEVNDEAGSLEDDAVDGNEIDEVDYTGSDAGDHDDYCDDGGYDDYYDDGGYDDYCDYDYSDGGYSSD